MHGYAVSVRKAGCMSELCGLNGLGVNLSMLSWARFEQSQSPIWQTSQELHLVTKGSSLYIRRVSSTPPQHCDCNHVQRSIRSRGLRQVVRVSIVRWGKACPASVLVAAS